MSAVRNAARAEALRIAGHPTLYELVMNIQKYLKALHGIEEKDVRADVILSSCPKCVALEAKIRALPSNQYLVTCLVCGHERKVKGL